MTYVTFRTALAEALTAINNGATEYRVGAYVFRPGGDFDGLSAAMTDGTDEYPCRPELHA